MLETIKDYWDVLVAVMLGAVWIGRVGQRVTTLEEEDSVSVDQCQERQVACQKYHAAELDHGKKEFADIDKSLADLRSEIREGRMERTTQHETIMKHLLKIGK